MKKTLWGTVMLALCFLVVGCSGVPQEELDSVSKKLSEKSAALETVQGDYDSLSAEHQALTEERDQLKAEIEKMTAQIAEKDALLEEAAPWFQKSEEEKQALIAEQEAAAEAERQAAEEREKVGYDTGITYDQLSRTPDDYEGEKVKFTGRVVQVIEGDTETQLRVATKGRYDDVILVFYPSNIASSRVLEEDTITLFGVSKGLYTYESTNGGPITIPLIQVDKIEN